MPLPPHAEIPEGPTERQRAERFRWFTLMDLMLLITGCTISGALARARVRHATGRVDRWTIAAFTLPAGLALVGPLILARQWLQGRTVRARRGERIWFFLALGWAAEIIASSIDPQRGTWVGCAGCGIPILVLGAYLDLVDTRHHTDPPPWTHFFGIGLLAVQVAAMFVPVILFALHLV